MRPSWSHGLAECELWAVLNVETGFALVIERADDQPRIDIPELADLLARSNEVTATEARVSG